MDTSALRRLAEILRRRPSAGIRLQRPDAVRIDEILPKLGPSCIGGAMDSVFIDLIDESR